MGGGPDETKSYIIDDMILVCLRVGLIRSVP
jgi:hypothetical protein